MVKFVGCPLGVNGCNSFSGSSYDNRYFAERWPQVVGKWVFVGSSGLCLFFLSYQGC